MILLKKRNSILEKVINDLAKEQKFGQLKTADEISIIIEKPKNPEFGDFSINVSPYARIAKIARYAIN